MKFKKGDPVLVFDNPGWQLGGVGVIKEIDLSEPNLPAFLIEDIASKFEGEDRWIREEFLFPLRFTKPTFLEKIQWVFPGLIPSFVQTIVNKISAIFKIIKG